MPSAEWSTRHGGAAQRTPPIRSRLIRQVLSRAFRMFICTRSVPVGPYRKIKNKKISPKRILDYPILARCVDPYDILLSRSLSLLPSPPFPLSLICVGFPAAPRRARGCVRSGTCIRRRRACRSILSRRHL